jgi:hypothetical protein
MLRRLVKLALAAFLVIAGWRIGAEYVTHFRFREAVRQATLAHRAEGQLRRAVLEEAGRFGVPLADEDLAIRLEERRTTVSGVYVKTIELVPGYERPWTFEWTVETFGAPVIDSAP